MANHKWTDEQLGVLKYYLIDGNCARSASLLTVANAMTKRFKVPFSKGQIAGVVFRLKRNPQETDRIVSVPDYTLFNAPAVIKRTPPLKQKKVELVAPKKVDVVSLIELVAKATEDCLSKTLEDSEPKRGLRGPRRLLAPYMDEVMYITKEDLEKYEPIDFSKVDLQPHHGRCKYPLWSGDEPISHKYCQNKAVRGTEGNTPWCEEHTILCTVPTRSRKGQHHTKEEYTLAQQRREFYMSNGARKASVMYSPDIK